MDGNDLANLLSAGIRTGTVILFATVGEIFAERAGVLNLGVEGMMLMGAMTGYGVAWVTGNIWLGFAAALLVGAIFALLHAFTTISLRADQVVSGLALTFLGAGMSAVLGASLVEVRDVPRLSTYAIPYLSQIPWAGRVLFQHNIIVYVGYLLVPLAWFYIFRTRPGMELRAIGEYPAAADVLGVSVYKQRYLYVILGGALAGLAGASMTLAVSPGWLDGKTAGLGWIAVGMVIFAGWDPVRAMIGAYLFGAISRLPLDLQNLSFFLSNPQYGYFLKMLPYLFVIIVLTLGARQAMRRRLGAPAALGVPYRREERGA